MSFVGQLKLEFSYSDLHCRALLNVAWHRIPVQWEIRENSKPSFTPKKLVYGSLGQTIGEWISFLVQISVIVFCSDFRDCLTPGGGVEGENRQAGQAEFDLGRHLSNMCLSQPLLLLIWAGCPRMVRYCPDLHINPDWPLLFPHIRPSLCIEAVVVSIFSSL